MPISKTIGLFKIGYKYACEPEKIIEEATHKQYLEFSNSPDMRKFNTLP